MYPFPGRYLDGFKVDVVVFLLNNLTCAYSSLVGGVKASQLETLVVRANYYCKGI